MNTTDLLNGYGFLATAFYGEYDADGNKIVFQNAYDAPDARAFELGDIAYYHDDTDAECLANELFLNMYPEMPNGWELMLMGVVCGTVGCDRIACTEIGCTAACARCAEPHAKAVRDIMREKQSKR